MRIPGLGRVRRLAMRLRDRLGTTAAILMYHRVADLERDPFALAVTPAHFRAHLEALRRRFHPLPLRELACRHRQDDLPERAVAITFDDGYVDNFRQALPLLQETQTPATVFVTTGCSGVGFWWDELEELILAPRALPTSGRLVANGSSLEWSLDSDAARPAGNWRPPGGDLTSRRHLDQRSKLFCDLHRLLQPLPHDERADAMSRLRHIAQSPAATTTPTQARTMTEPELLALANESLVEIGVHTVTHPLLTAQPLAIQAAEVRDSRIRVEEILGRKVYGMSYPWGAYQPQTVRAVESAGYEYACACGDRPVLRSSPIYELPRFNIVDSDGDAFARRLEEVFA